MVKEKQGKLIIKRKKRILSYLAEIFVGVLILIVFYFILMIALN